MEKTININQEPYFIFEYRDNYFYKACSVVFTNLSTGPGYGYKYEDKELFLGLDLFEDPIDDTIHMRCLKEEVNAKAILELQKFANNGFYDYVSYHKIGGKDKSEGKLANLIDSIGNIGFYEIRPRVFRRFLETDFVIPNKDLYDLPFRDIANNPRRNKQFSMSV